MSDQQRLSERIRDLSASVIADEWSEEAEALEIQLAEAQAERLTIQRAIAKTQIGGDGSEDDDVKYSLDEITDHIAEMDRQRKERLQQAQQLGNLLGNLLTVIHRDGGHYQCAYGTTKACEDAEKLSASRIQAEDALELATAKLATARVCDDCWRYQDNEKCDCCNNGVRFSDERARELLERLKRAEEDSELMDWLASDDCVQFWKDDSEIWTAEASTGKSGQSDDPREAIRAARAKEGKE